MDHAIRTPRLRPVYAAHVLVQSWQPLSILMGPILGGGLSISVGGLVITPQAISLWRWLPPPSSFLPHATREAACGRDAFVPLLPPQGVCLLNCKFPQLQKALKGLKLPGLFYNPLQALHGSLEMNAPPGPPGGATVSSCGVPLYFPGCWPLVKFRVSTVVAGKFAFLLVGGKPKGLPLEREPHSVMVRFSAINLQHMPPNLLCTFLKECVHTRKALGHRGQRPAYPNLMHTFPGCLPSRSPGRAQGHVLGSRAQVAAPREGRAHVSGASVTGQCRPSNEFFEHFCFVFQFFFLPSCGLTITLNRLPTAFKNLNKVQRVPGTQFEACLLQQCCSNALNGLRSNAHPQPIWFLGIACR